MTRSKFIPFLSPVLVLLAGCAVQAPESGDDIPRRLAEELANGQIYTEIPEGFPVFDLPDAVFVQGGLDRGFSFMLLLASEMPADVLESQVRESFEDAGWIALSSFPNQPAGGFLGIQGQPRLGIRGISNQPAQLCHDRYGILTINPRQHLGILNRVSLDWNYNANNPGGFDCAEQEEQRQGNFRPRIPSRDLNQFMPVLELPEEDQGPRFRPFFGGGISGSGDTLTARSPLQLDWDMDEILDWFGNQLEEQGWERDASWEGDTSAGSSWTGEFSGDDGEVALIGLLDVTHLEENNYQLHFRLGYRQR